MSNLANAAYHEAGHAVMSCRFGVPPDYVEIYPDETGITFYGDRLVTVKDGVGWSFYDLTIRETLRARMPDRAAFDRRLTSLFEAEIMISLAGPVAEQRYRKVRSPRGRRMLMGGNGDWDYIERAFHAFLGHHPNDDGFYFWLITSDVRNFFRRKNAWIAVQRVAAELVDHNEVTGDRVVEIVAGAGVKIQYLGD